MQSDKTKPFTIHHSPFTILAAAAAGLCWSGALALLIFGGLSAAEPPLAPQRLLYYGLTLGAALLTFAPIERGLDMPGLTVEGVVGASLLLYGLAFVPPPTEWLLSPPDMPVYALLIGALFLCGAATSRPFIAAVGRRIYKERVHALDRRRVRRQSYEVGLLVATLAALAGLRVLTWVSVLLLALAVTVAELLFLARFEAK
ncbi:hypothetical protein K2Z83_17975 [Oscillochloris sp. ZM17-4]|uniref:hypothetical protein n=1 Tax=Oscillochloris sp. ZM17-4 TaxID=2866714 RepID=UPI001C73D102|nr:hypothetical protein [Oscillochloris sp. ZM17-4]MBX0329562.1 hypothetical protein [Oscillochloris sp. ZM17-4]